MPQAIIGVVIGWAITRGLDAAARKIQQRKQTRKGRTFEHQGDAYAHAKSK